MTFFVCISDLMSQHIPPWTWHMAPFTCTVSSLPSLRVHMQSSARMAFPQLLLIFHCVCTCVHPGVLVCVHGHVWSSIYNFTNIVCYMSSLHLRIYVCVYGRVHIMCVWGCTACVYGGVQHVCMEGRAWHTHASQRITCGSCLSPSTTWVWGMEFTLSGQVWC